MLAHDTSKELRPDEILRIRNARLLQFTAAGVDWVPTRDLPRELPVAANKGGGAEPMSEHIVALALAAANGVPLRGIRFLTCSGGGGVSDCPGSGAAETRPKPLRNRAGKCGAVGRPTWLMPPRRPPSAGPTGSSSRCSGFRR